MNDYERFDKLKSVLRRYHGLVPLELVQTELGFSSTEALQSWLVLRGLTDLQIDFKAKNVVIKLNSSSDLEQTLREIESLERSV